MAVAQQRPAPTYQSLFLGSKTIFTNNPFRRKDDESKKKRHDRDDQKEAPRGGSRASSRDNHKRPPYDVTFKTTSESNLRRTIGQYATMSRLAGDVGILLQDAEGKLEELRKTDERLSGLGPVGTDVKRYIKKEEKDLKGEEPMQRGGNVKAHDDLSKDVPGSSSETSETTRTMKTIGVYLRLTLDRYSGILKSDDCQKNEDKKKVVQELLSSSLKLKAKHEEALSILAIDNPQEQSRESRSDTRVSRPKNARNHTEHARKPLSKSS
ncbi:uncharacterized protein EAF01_001804 [Botrytis porri]|uniref:uncharacterized protein n=1 Tax=Botrytis porri TaxID=87229 RepID=UPI0019028157|nr:uncharacterized protein EAF01_001804 [Botrytis porri]KAF7912783.1 hypothetical protein EAF01_001804 [Botrytis porri]